MAFSLAAWLACAGLLRLFIAGFTPLSFDLPPATVMAAMVTNAVLAIGAIVCAWYLLTATAIAVGAVTRIAGSTSTRFDEFVSRVGAPVLRKAALWGTACSLALGSSTAAVALADGDPTGQEVQQVATEVHVPQNPRNARFLVDLGWPATPAHPAPSEPSAAPPAPTKPPSAAPAPAPAPEPAPTRESQPKSSHLGAAHVVEVGDTLWAIAETQLRDHQGQPTPAQIAAHWPRWHTENIDVIGPNPHHIIPGTPLVAPPLEDS